MTKREAERTVLHTLIAILTRGSIVDSDDPEVIEKCCGVQHDLATWICMKKRRAMSDQKSPQ